MKVISLAQKRYGFGVQGRYRIMAETQVVQHFLDLGWVPPYTVEQRKAEVERRMKESELTKDEAEFEVDDDIQRDLEEWIFLRFSKAASC